MGFGYALMKGQNGMEGYIRVSSGKRTVQVRGLPAGAQCALYALNGNGAKKSAQAMADQSGQCRMNVTDEGPLFAAVDGRVRLWEGGDETYLRASAFLGKKDAPRQTEAMKTKTVETEMKAAENPPTAKEPEPPIPDEPFSPYTLRPAGKGENVDALPPRSIT